MPVQQNSPQQSPVYNSPYYGYGNTSGSSGFSAPAAAPATPDDPDFWEQFATEWVNAKENMLENDRFLKEELQPAFDTYQQKLAGISEPTNFNRVNIGMGDFSTSFVPKRDLQYDLNEKTLRSQNARDILGSEIQEADIMRPKSGEMNYLDRLQALGMFEKGLQNQVQIAEISREQPDDKGTWLDAIGDIVGIGGGIKDIFF